MWLLRSLFTALASGRFPEVQASFGSSGLHARIVHATLDILERGILREDAEEVRCKHATMMRWQSRSPPCLSPPQELLLLELCLLAPARLEHLIPPMSRMMRAILYALQGSERLVGVALKVLDTWVDSFNPEFIERSMAGVIKQLMIQLWAHIQPPPYPFGLKVAEVLGKLGGRSRRWLLDGLAGEYKPIPEYGLRIILAFPPQTSFLVPLDRCIQFATAALQGLAPRTISAEH